MRDKAESHRENDREHTRDGESANPHGQSRWSILDGCSTGMANDSREIDKCCVISLRHKLDGIHQLQDTQQGTFVTWGARGPFPFSDWKSRSILHRSRSGGVGMTEHGLTIVNPMKTLETQQGTLGGSAEIVRIWVFRLSSSGPFGFWGFGTDVDARDIRWTRYIRASSIVA